MDLSIIIPVFCSEQSINELHTRIIKSLNKTKYTYEIIFVDDASTDKSWKEIQKICKNKNTVGISMGKNYGQHNCIFCGIKNAKGNYIVTMDDDLQHPPEEIVNIFKFIKKGYDVVYATPKKLQHSSFRNVTTKITKLLLDRMMGSNQSTNINSFRVFKKDLMKTFIDINYANINIDVLLSWTTNNFGTIKIDHEIRKFGKSGYTSRKLFLHAIKLITNFSSFPLKLATIIGLLFSFFGFIILLYVVFYALILGSPVRGFPFLASIISIFAGVQLLTLGIFGEYIATIHSKSISKPSYVIKKIINKK